MEEGGGAIFITSQARLSDSSFAGSVIRPSRAGLPGCQAKSSFAGSDVMPGRAGLPELPVKLAGDRRLAGHTIVNKLWAHCHSRFH